jgi:hypothetical protein
MRGRQEAALEIGQVPSLAGVGRRSAFRFWKKRLMRAIEPCW